MKLCGIDGGVLFSHYPIGYKSDGWSAKDRMEQVLDDAYALYSKDDTTMSGVEKTDLLAGLLRKYGSEENCG